VYRHAHMHSHTRWRTRAPPAALLRRARPADAAGSTVQRRGRAPTTLFAMGCPPAPAPTAAPPRTARPWARPSALPLNARTHTHKHTYTHTHIHTHARRVRRRADAKRAHTHLGQTVDERLIHAKPLGDAQTRLDTALQQGNTGARVRTHKEAAVLPLHRPQHLWGTRPGGPLSTSFRTRCAAATRPMPIRPSRQTDRQTDGPRGWRRSRASSGAAQTPSPTPRGAGRAETRGSTWTGPVPRRAGAAAAHSCTWTTSHGRRPSRGRAPSGS
jgi:hypothetical protein